MANENAYRDSNQVTVLLAVDDTTGETVRVPVDSDGNLLVVGTFTAATVPDGGTGRTSFTAYAPIFGGTTSTGALQSGTVGNSGEVLTSNGAGFLPTFQANGNGTVTSVSVTTANGVSGVVATATTTPAITLTLGDITPSSANVAGANVVTSTTTLGNVNIRTTNAQAIDVGGSLTLGGYNDNAASAVRVFGSIEGRKENGTTGTSAGYLILKTNNAGSLTSQVRISSTGAVTPGTNDASVLGTASLQWSDLFLAEGGVINWDNGDATMTQTANDITIAGITTFGVGTSTAVTLGTIELSNTDTTISRSSGGVIAVEGVVIPSISSTNTLTNKRVTRRLTTTNAPGATPTTNTDNVDIANFTGLGTAITSMTTNLSGSPVLGDLLEFRFTDDGTARGLTFGASFAATTVALPTTTVISTTLRVLFEWGGSTWDCIATA